MPRKADSKRAGPFIREERNLCLIALKITKPMLLTQSHNARLNMGDDAVCELSFERADVLSLRGDDGEFQPGEVLYVIAVHEDKSVYSAVTACSKELYMCFEASFKSLKDITEWQKLLFRMPVPRRANILLQLGLIQWSEDLEISNLLLRQEYELKLRLCKEQMPPNLIELINYHLSSEDMSGGIVSSDAYKLANFTYSNDEVRALPFRQTAAYLKKHTYLKPKDIERLATALSQPRERELRLFLEGYDSAGMDELIEALVKLKRMPLAKISCEGLSAACEVVGESKNFKDSDVSLPVRLWSEAKSNRCIFVYEDLTSLGESREHGSAKAAAKQIIGEDACFDEYFKTNFPMKHTLIIATGESYSDLHPGVRDLFDIVIHFEMSDEDKFEVIKEHILPELIEEKHVHITDGALRLTVQHTDDLGLRRTLCHLRFLINEAQTNEVIDEDFVSAKLSAVDNDCSPYIKYKLHRDAYCPEVAEAIEETQKKLLRKNADKKADYSYLNDRLDKLVQLRNNERCFEYKKGTLVKKISKIMFGVEAVASQLDDYFTACSTLNIKDRMNVMLVGNPGSGKSTFALEAAYAAGAEEVCTIDMSIATAEQILGVSRNHFGARSSKVAETWAKNPNFAIVLEEVDKANPEALFLLLKMLDGAQILQEKYLEVNLPLKNIHIFATANSLNIPLPVLDRFRVFSFETSDRIKAGAFDKVIEKMEEASENRKLRIDVDPLAKALILDKYSTSSSVRELEALLGRVKEHLVANAEAQQGEELHITIDEAAVSEAISLPHKRGNADTVPEGIPGCVRGTAVTEYGVGMTFGVECLVFESDAPSLEITGLAQDEVREQVKLAITHINANYSCLLEGKTVHIHYSEAGVKKHGTSAGAATYIAILSAALGIPVSRGIAITGEIGLHGGINAIGGAELKAAAAARDGCRLMVMPQENLARISALDRAYLEQKIELMGISRIEELVELAMPGITRKKIIKIS